MHLPRRVGIAAHIASAAPIGDRFRWHVERLVPRPAQRLARQLDLGDAERLTVRFGRVHLVGAAVADVRPTDDERGPCGLGLCGGDRRVERVEVIDVGDAEDVPSVTLESAFHIVGERQIGRTVDRDMVVVVEADQLAELEMPGE